MNRFLTNIKSFTSKNYNIIIVCLLVLLIMRGCKSCSNERAYEYKQNQYEYVIDSLNTTIIDTTKYFEFECRKLNDSIHLLNAKNNIINEAFKDVKTDRDHYRKVNNDLVNLTIKKDTL